jgi:hypothetical protein
MQPGFPRECAEVPGPHRRPGQIGMKARRQRPERSLPGQEASGHGSGPEIGVKGRQPVRLMQGAGNGVMLTRADLGTEPGREGRGSHAEKMRVRRAE